MRAITIRAWRGLTGHGRGGHAGGMVGATAGVMLALLGLVAAVPPAAAQGLPVERYQLQYNHQPMALAYLAARYEGRPTGRAPEFKSADALVARFLPPAGLQPWEGIPFGLFRRGGTPDIRTRVGVTGNALGMGRGTPLDFRLYAFLPPEQGAASLRLLMYESDAWTSASQAFSVVSDTTFVLNVSTNGLVTESVACVNRRSAPDVRAGRCEEGTGEVIEDPLSGEPALLMLPRRDPPWLASVPTEICVEDGGKVPRVAVPGPGNAGTFAQVPLDHRKGRRLCTPSSLRLNYVLVRQYGIEVDGVKLLRLGSRGVATPGWKLLAEAPDAGGLTQRILLVPPGSAAVAGAPKPPVPVAVVAAPPTFAVHLDEWRWDLTLTRKLWYGPLPAAADAGSPFKCEKGGLVLGTEVWGRDRLTEADAVSVHNVFKFPPALRMDVTQPPAKLVSLRRGLVLVVQTAGGRTYCGMATPLPDGSELAGRLVLEEKPAPPPVVSVSLTFQREGPAVLSLELVSQGKVTKLADLAEPSLTRSVRWSDGDSIRVRPADPDFHGVSAVKVDGASLAVRDDKSVEVPLAAGTRTIAIETALRQFTMPLAVATPHGAVEISVGSGKAILPGNAKPTTVVLKGVRLGEEVTVEAQDADRLMVARLTLQGGGSPRAVDGPMLKFERADILGRRGDLRLDVELKPNTLVLPAELWLKPVVHLGKRPLALASCKVTLAGLPAEEFHHGRDGRTHVKVSPDKRGRATYRVEVSGTAKVCAGFVGEVMPAQKVAALAKGTELAIPVRRPGSRAFVGVLSWPLGGKDDEGNWRAALKALTEAYDAGAEAGTYLWGAIYALDGKRLAASETADYTPLAVDPDSPETIGRFKAGSGAPGYEEAVKRVLADVADMEGSVDLLVVAAGAEAAAGACKWADPFTTAAPRNGRSALVRVVKAAPGQPTDVASRARMCDVDGDQGRVSLAVQVAVEPAIVGGASDRLLREALEAAATSLLAPEKAEAEPPPPDRKAASAAPAPGETPAAETYDSHYHLPVDYRPLAVAYLAAPYAGAFTGPAGAFRIGPVAPGASLTVRFLKRAGGVRPWEGMTLGLFRGESGKPGSRLSAAEGTLGLGGSKALHPTLYAFVPEDLPVAGFRVLTFESDAGRKASEAFSLLADTSFLLKAYLDGDKLGVVETVACLNRRTSPPPCDGETGQAVEDPLSGGPALLMVGSGGPPRWLAAVPTEVCVDGAGTAPPKVVVPGGAAKPREVRLVRQAERWCSDATRLDYVAVRADGIRIAGEPPKKRLDSRLQAAGAWSLHAAAPKKGADGEWVQQLVLAPAKAR